MDYEKQLQLKTLELENLQKSFEEYVESSKELEGELENALAANETKLKDAERRLSLSDTKLKQTQEQLQRTTQENSALQNEMNVLRDRLLNLETKKRELENDNDDISNQLRIVQATEEDLRHQLENAEEDAVYLKTDLYELKQEREQAEELLQNELKLLREQLEIQDSKHSEKERLISDDSIEIENTIHNGFHCERCSTLEIKIHDMEDIIGDMEQKNNQLQQKITELNLSLASYNTSKDPEASEADIVRVLRDEIDNLNDMVTQKDFELQGMQQIKEELFAKDEQIRYLEREFMESNKSTYGIFKASSTSKPLPSSMKKLNTTITIDQTRTIHHRLQNLMDGEDVNAIKSELITMANKFEQERIMNINLLNKIQTVRGNILVCCRTRPASDQELSAGGKLIVDASNEYEVMFFDNRNDAWKSFIFDRVWREDASQADVFSDIEPLAVSVAEGYNACIIAYGQTGSGKTFTMDGYDEEYGVSYRTLNKVFEILDAKKLKANADAKHSDIKAKPSINSSLLSSPSKTPLKEFQPISSLYNNNNDSNSQPSSRPSTPRSSFSSHSGRSTPTFNHSEMKRQPVSFEFINPMNKRQSLNTSSLLSPNNGNNSNNNSSSRSGTPNSNATSNLHSNNNLHTSGHHLSSSNDALKYTAQSMIIHDIPTVTYDFLDADILSVNSMMDDENGNGEDEEDHFKYCVEISMMEIYNEQVYDLLDDNLGGGQTDGISLDIRVAPDNTVTVPGLKQVVVTNMDEVNKVFHRGAKNRATATTNLNNNSSRSHLIIQVEVTIEESPNTFTKGKLFLVDLAGSERLNKSGAKGAVLKEAQYINKSLSALGDVMEALDQRQKHIPYRNSKLTHLLQNALGGNARAMMVFTVCPTNMTSDETLFTLQFASRVRNIQLGAAQRNNTVNTKNLEMALRNIRNEMKDMKKKNIQLEESLAENKREQKKSFDKLTVPLENKIKSLEEAKKLAETLSLQLNKQLQENIMKLQEDKQSKQQLTQELEFTQHNIKQLTYQYNECNDEITRLTTMLMKREEEIIRLQHHGQHHHSSNNNSNVNGSMDTTHGPSPSRTLSPQPKLVSSLSASSTSTSNMTTTVTTATQEKKVMFADQHQVVTLSSSATAPITPIHKNGSKASTTTIIITPQSVLKRTIDISSSETIAVPAPTPTTPIATATATTASTTPSTPKARTPVISKMASLFNRSSSQSPAPNKLSSSASTNSPTPTNTGNNTTNNGGISTSTSTYQRMIRAISPGLVGKPSSNTANSSNITPTKATTTVAKSSTGNPVATATTTSSSTTSATAAAATRKVTATNTTIASTAAVVVSTPIRTTSSSSSSVAAAVPVTLTTTATVTAIAAPATPTITLEDEDDNDEDNHNINRTYIPDNNDLDILPSDSHPVSSSSSQPCTNTDTSADTDPVLIKHSSMFSEGNIPPSLSTHSSSFITTTQDANSSAATTTAATTTTASVDSTIATETTATSINGSSLNYPLSPSANSTASAGGRVTTVLSRSEEALRRHQLRMEKKREATGERFKKI